MILLQRFESRHLSRSIGILHQAVSMSISKVSECPTNARSDRQEPFSARRKRMAVPAAWSPSTCMQANVGRPAPEQSISRSHDQRLGLLCPPTPASFSPHGGGRGVLRWRFVYDGTRSRINDGGTRESWRQRGCLSVCLSCRRPNEGAVREQRGERRSSATGLDRPLGSFFSCPIICGVHMCIFSQRLTIWESGERLNFPGLIICR